MSATAQAPDLAKSLQDLEARFAPMAEGQPVLQAILALILRLFRCLIANPAAAPAPEPTRTRAVRQPRRLPRRSAPRLQPRARRVARLAAPACPRAGYFLRVSSLPASPPRIATKGGLRFSSA